MKVRKCSRLPAGSNKQPATPGPAQSQKRARETLPWQTSQTIHTEYNNRSLHDGGTGGPGWPRARTWWRSELLRGGTPTVTRGATTRRGRPKVTSLVDCRALIPVDIFVFIQISPPCRFVVERSTVTKEYQFRAEKSTFSVPCARLDQHKKRNEPQGKRAIAQSSARPPTPLFSARKGKVRTLRTHT